MPSVATHLLTFNVGSSSLRFAVYDTQPSLCLRTSGKLTGIATKTARLSVYDAHGAPISNDNLEAPDHHVAINALLAWLDRQRIFATLGAVGHRIVHGMTHANPERVTPALLDELRHLMPFAPEHLPYEIAMIEAIQQRDPALPQVACFDTAFHRDMPRIATLLPLPRRYDRLGIKRYGFHGLSYAYLMEELRHLDNHIATQGKVILAHLGNGASLAAINNGQCIDTSMGFTPTAGLMMGSRSGDLDPGLIHYLVQTEQMSTMQFQHMVNHESGLLGVSELSADIRELLARETDDIRAAEAVALFCYQVKKWLGSFSAALGGLDTLVFAGGIGENAPIIRTRICAGLDFLGISLDPALNAKNAPIISSTNSNIAVRVIRTDEELMIARSTSHVLGINATETT